MNADWTVYLLHFDRSVTGFQTSGQHYTGSTGRLDGRVADHERGTGAKFTRRAKEQGIGFRVVAVWAFDTRSEMLRAERQIKLNTLQLCPVCRGPGHGGRPAERLMSDRYDLTELDSVT